MTANREPGRPLNILVAGGAGFVGSNLCESLLELGNSVTCLDNLVTGRRINILGLMDHPGFRFVEADIVASLPDIGPFDRVYHLASPASPPGYQRFPVETLRTNSEGTLRLLEIASSSFARFLYASTSEAYGDPLEHPQRETYRGNVSSTGPRSMYDEGKRFAEALTVAYARERGADARIVRIFNSYGPRMQLADGRMPSSFIGAAVRGADLQVHGDGSQMRSLCFVADTVRGLRAAMERGRSGEVYNIGRADEVSVLDFARLVVRAASSHSNVISVAGRPQDIQRRCPDGTKSQRELGWRPKIALDEGLRETIAWYRQAIPAAVTGSLTAAT